MKLRVGGFLRHSRANGPGNRAAIWVQGCSLRCPGCFNPDTHPFSGGALVPTDDIFARLVALADSIEGITVSGGEPLQQRQALLALLRRVRHETGLSVLVLTGYSMEEVRRLPGAEALLACIDVLIAGRYDRTRRLAQGLRGSANKTVHFLTSRYKMADLDAVPLAEVIITPGGDVILSGIDAPACGKWSSDGDASG